MSFPPLYGGGLLVALAQVAVVYYAVAAALHCVVPWLLRPPSIQPAPRWAGQAWREARNSLGAASCLRHTCCLLLLEDLFGALLLDTLRECCATCEQSNRGRHAVCPGPIVVKAVVLTAVERLHAAGFGKMYATWPSTLTEVCPPASSRHLLQR